jgi:hypothetical protein
MHPTADIYRDILTRTAARYLTVRPHGIEIAPGYQPLKRLPVLIIDHGAARTFYRERKPVCRSLDGIHPVQHPERQCYDCTDRERCTPQVRVDLVFDCVPYRLLLAYTSAKNFLFYHTEIVKARRKLPDVITRIRVINRGTWGELRFSTAPPNGDPVSS